MFTPARRSSRRTRACTFASPTNTHTVSLAVRWRTISAYTQGMAANLPGQSAAWCGQATHVARCGSHSAGMRNSSLVMGRWSVVAVDCPPFYDEPPRCPRRRRAVTELFRPWFWLRNPHLQTILGVVCKSRAFPHPTVRRRVRLADGDRLVLHDTTPPAWRPGDPVAVIVHGLGGCHRSGGVVRLARLLLRPGVRVVRLDLRGTGAGFPLARGSYNAGCSADVRAALEAVHGFAPDS